MKRIHLASALAIFAADPVMAQQAPPTNYGIGTVTAVTTATKVTPEHYAQLVASMAVPTFPEAKKPDLISTIFNALGGATADVRKINVTLRIRYGDIQLPDHSLVTYTMDRRNNSISAEVGASGEFLLYRLAGRPIQIEIVYKDIKQREFDFNAVAKSIGGLVPGSAVLSVASEPFVQKIAQTASAVLGTMTSSNVNSAYRDLLSPDSDGKKSLKIQLKTPNGNEFGIVDLRLRSTATALRTPVPVASAGDADFKFGAMEDTSTLAFDAAGVRRSYLTEVRAMPEYRELVKTGQNPALATFCAQARTLLSVMHGLTLMDRTDVMFGALAEAGYRLSGDVGWYNVCFSSAEAAMLKTSRGLEPVAAASNLTPPLLHAFGCWAMQSTGPRCQVVAPRSEETLLAAFADNVTFEVDSAFIPSADMGEHPLFVKSEVMTLLKSRASGYKCFKDGVLLTQGDDAAAFRLRGIITGGKIVSIRIQSVPLSALDCI